MFQNLRKSKKLLLIAMTCATFAIAGCGSDTTKTTGDNGTSVTWSETFDGTKTDFAVKSAPTHAVSMSQATTEMMLQLGLEDKMAGTAFKEEEIYPPLQAAYDKVKVLSDKWPSYEVFMSVKPDFATGWPDSFSKRAIPADKMISQKVNIWIPESMLSTKADLETNFSDMIKLGEIFGVELKKREEVIPYAKKLQEKGAKNVLVSMAGEGAVLIDENGREYMSPVPKGKVVNAVGAGDSMVAGFIAGYLEKKDYEYAFHMGIASGSASAFSEQLATRAEVEALLKTIHSAG